MNQFWLGPMVRLVQREAAGISLVSRETKTSLSLALQTPCDPDRAHRGSAAPSPHSLPPSSVPLPAPEHAAAPGTLQNKCGSHRVLHPQPSALQVLQGGFRGHFSSRLPVAAQLGCVCCSTQRQSLASGKCLEILPQFQLGFGSPPCPVGAQGQQ